MTKTELETKLAETKSRYKSDLQTLWDNINKGQRKQLIKIESIRAMLDRYGVEYDD